MYVARSRYPYARLQGRSEVCQYVSEEIVGDDYVVMARVQDHEHRRRVNILVVRFDLGVARRRLFEDPLPEVAAEALNVRLVGHRHAPTTALARVRERGDDDALDTFARVQLLLSGYLVRRAALQEAARAAVRALGVLAKDDEVYVFG